MRTSTISSGVLDTSVFIATETGRAAGDLAAIPVDASAAHQWATIQVALRDAGRRRHVNDSWIAACALAHDLPVVPQDDDYAVITDLVGLAVICV